MNPVDDFLKTAGFMDVLRRGAEAFKRGVSGTAVPQRTLGEAVMQGVGQAVPTAAAATLVVGGASAAGSGISALGDRMTKSRDYKAMLGASPELRKHDAGHVQMVYNSLRTHAPSLAKDPLVAGSFVRKTLLMSPPEGPQIDPQTLKMVVDTQRGITQARQSRGGVIEAFRPTQLHPMKYSDPSQ